MRLILDDSRMWFSHPKQRGAAFSKLLGVALCLMAGDGACAAQATLPQGFVYLSDVDPSIVQDIRYYTSRNFTGHKIDGYDAPECILSEKAALALSKVQAGLRRDNLSLIVWDCYRPKRAVADFLRWSKDPSAPGRKAEFFPNLAKGALFAKGYVAARSAHSRGSAVDLGLIQEGASPSPVDPAAPPVACTASKEERFQDQTIDMGTAFDCMDKRANIGDAKISADARKNRERLRRAMIAAGFRPYEKEWWHFELKDDPFKEKSFDFPIEGKAR